MTKPKADRSIHEIQHGKKLAQENPELTWGWATEAGRLRAGRRSQLICDGAGLTAGKHVLEIGCGSGLFTAALAETGAMILAVDISSELIQLAGQRGLPPERVRFLVRPFEDCLAEGPFDAVVGSSVLHHLEIEPAIQQIYQLLKPGGVISFAEPNMLNPQIMVQKNVPWIKEMAGDSPDETAFFRWPFKKMLEKNGFTKVEITPFDWLHPHLPKGLIRPTEGIRNLLERIPVIREIAGSLYIRAVRP